MSPELKRGPISPDTEPYVKKMVVPRLDMLQFVQKHIHPTVHEDFADNPQGWLDELAIIYGMLSMEGPVRISGNSFPLSREDPDVQKLGESALVYRGKNKRLRGIWTEGKEGWIKHVFPMDAELSISPEYKDLPQDVFLPDEVEKRGIKIKGDRRPIFECGIKKGDREQKVFVKGVSFNPTFLYEQPSYRLTSVVGIEKESLKTEKDIFLKLSKKGVHVPEIIAHYDSPLEEYLFLEKIEGRNPEEYMKTHRETIITQDSAMLASLCSLGYRKLGFEDFDDKLFYGKNLYLIDADECQDLYADLDLDFKKIVLDPTDKKSLQKFRNYQKTRLKQSLRDTIFRYSETLTPNLEDKSLYVNSFFVAMGWGTPKPELVRQLTTFPKNYMTWETYRAMSSEE